MSYIRTIIRDQSRTINGEVHGYFGDALVAALTAEPETVEELGSALARFVKPPSDSPPFGGFREGENYETYDAGIVVIDLAARVVVVDSSYSQPSADGSFRVQSDFVDEDFDLPYRLSDEWLFVYSISEYESVCRRRCEETEERKPFDAREVLYGKPLLEFIAGECLAAGSSDDAELFTKIHAKWLMTGREDLAGKTPREVLLEKQEFIDFDLQSRELQWSFTKEAPPPLPLSSRAYRLSGFGTHECVVYYDLFRYLLHESLESLNAQGGQSADVSIEVLAELQTMWVEEPNVEFGARSRADIIEWERRRLPLIMSSRDIPIDEDCPLCVDLAEDFDNPGFWHLDGCNMDEDFAFSFYKTRGEFEEAERERQEFNRKFERDWKAGKYNKPFDESLIDVDGEPPF